MISFPNCKINLGLHILRKRTDGFHDLETVFYPIPLQDALEVIHQPVDSKEAVAFTTSGITVESDSNICIKAYQLLQKDMELPPVQMHLHKAIPIGAGLGGGSADGAFTLMLLNKKFNLQLQEDQLIKYAAELGSDCPFFIKNHPCFATGRGEQLEEITVDLTAYKIVLVNPQIHINTGWAFSHLTPDSNRTSLKEVIQRPVENWKDRLTNDFEVPIFLQYPEIGHIKNTLYQQGAVFAAMTGSGSTVYGIFGKDVPLHLSFPAHYFLKEMITLVSMER